MSFTDHKISQFVHRVVDLPDQPNLPSDELKARFDSSPEELRVAHNALCDDADRLDDRVSGIIAETFGDTISKSMLSDELADEIDAKATKAELDEDTAALDARLDTVETALPTKCEVYFGSYEGDGNATQDISLGFTPQAIIIMRKDGATCMQFDCNGGIAMPGLACVYDGSTAIEIITNGFRVFSTKISSSYYVRTNDSNRTFYYFAVK